VLNFFLDSGLTLLFLCRLSKGDIQHERILSNDDVKISWSQRSPYKVQWRGEVLHDIGEIAKIHLSAIHFLDLSPFRRRKQTLEKQKV